MTEQCFFVWSKYDIDLSNRSLSRRNIFPKDYGFFSNHFRLEEPTITCGGKRDN
jgi:hypothetical protein